MVPRWAGEGSKPIPNRKANEEAHQDDHMTTLDLQKAWTCLGTFPPPPGGISGGLGGGGLPECMSADIRLVWSLPTTESD